MSRDRQLYFLRVITLLAEHGILLTSTVSNLSFLTIDVALLDLNKQNDTKPWLI